MMERIYLPNTPLAALGRACHFIALAGFADVMIGRELRTLKERARRAPQHEHQAIAYRYAMVMESFHRATRSWWRYAELWPVGYVMPST